MFFTPAKVSGPSMLPHLSDGQRLFVAPTWLRKPKRGQVVVFKEPDTGKLAVKRVLGLPGESVQINQGDLFISGQRHQRVPLTMRALVPLIDLSGASIEQALGPKNSQGVRMLSRLPYDGFLLSGKFYDGEMPATDLTITIEFELDENGEIIMQLQEGDNVFQLVANQDKLELSLNGLAWPAQQRNLKSASSSISLAKLDQQVSVICDGEIVLGPFAYPVAEATPLVDVPQRPPTEQVGVGGAEMKIKKLQVGRDLFFTADGTWGTAEELQLAEDEYFLLGDNHRASRDSRNYGPVNGELLIGCAGPIWELSGEGN